jgi:hypothetical protein
MVRRRISLAAAGCHQQRRTPGKRAHEASP